MKEQIKPTEQKRLMRLMNWLLDRLFSRVDWKQKLQYDRFPSSVRGALSKQSAERAGAKRPRTLGKKVRQAVHEENKLLEEDLGQTNKEKAFMPERLFLRLTFVSIFSLHT